MKRYGWTIPILVRSLKNFDSARFTALANACLTCDTYDHLAEIRCPALVVGAAEDKITTAAAAREIAERIGCTYKEYAEFGHGAYDEAKDFNDVIFGFVRANRQEARA